MSASQAIGPRLSLPALAMRGRVPPRLPGVGPLLLVGGAYLLAEFAARQWKRMEEEWRSAHPFPTTSGFYLEASCPPDEFIYQAYHPIGGDVRGPAWDALKAQVNGCINITGAPSSSESLEDCCAYIGAKDMAAEVGPFTIRLSSAWRRPFQGEAYNYPMALQTTDWIQYGEDVRSRPIAFPHPYPLPGQAARRSAAVGNAQSGRVFSSVSLPHDFAEGGRFTADGSVRERPSVVPVVIAMPGDAVDARSRPVPIPGQLPDVSVIPGVGGGVRPGESGLADAGTGVSPAFAVQLTRSHPIQVATAALSPAPRGEKQVKVARHTGRFASGIGYNFTTELRDAVTALWDNIPDDCKKFRTKGRLRGRRYIQKTPAVGRQFNATFGKDRATYKRVVNKKLRFEPGSTAGNRRHSSHPTLARMMQDIYNHPGCIEWNPWNEVRRVGRSGSRTVAHRGAARDLLLNEAGDRFFGKLGSAAGGVARQLGYSHGVQLGGGLGNRSTGPGNPVTWAAEQLGF